MTSAARCGHPLCALLGDPCQLATGVSRGCRTGFHPARTIDPAVVAEVTELLAILVAATPIAAPPPPTAPPSITPRSPTARPPTAPPSTSPPSITPPPIATPPSRTSASPALHAAATRLAFLHRREARDERNLLTLARDGTLDDPLAAALVHLCTRAR